MPKIGFFETIRRTIDVAVKRMDSAYANPSSSLGVDGADPVQDAIVKTPRYIDDEDLLSLWRSSQYAAIGVDDMAQAATKKGWRVSTNEALPKGLNLDASDLARGVDDDWSVWLTVCQGAQWGRLFGLGALILVVDDGKHPSEPFDINRPFRLLNIVIADKRELTPARWNDDMAKRGFQTPELWHYAPRAVSSGAGYRTIHDSRIIKFGGRPVPKDVMQDNLGADDSVLRPALDAIQHKSTNDDARAVLMHDFKVDVVTTPDVDSIATSDEKTAYLDDRMGLLARGKSLLNLILLDGGETYSKSSTSVAGVADLDDRTTAELATALRMPQARLTGEAPGGLNTDGESQTKNWNDQVAAYQTLELGPNLIRLYRIFFAATNGPTNGYVPKEFFVEFNALDEPTEKQRADLRFVVAQTDAVYLDRAVITPEHVQRGRFGEGAWSVDLPPAEAYEDLPDDTAFDFSTIETPEAAPAPVAEPEVKPSELVLNGAQIASMVQVAASVASGEISAESGRAIIMQAFNVDSETAAQIVGQKMPSAGTPQKPASELQP